MCMFLCFWKYIPHRKRQMEEEKSLMDFLESFEYSIIHPKIFKGLTVYWHHSRCWGSPNETHPLLGCLYFIGEFDNKSEQL